MEHIKITAFSCLLVFVLGIHKVCAKNGSAEVSTATSHAEANPLATAILDKNVIEDVNNSNRLADEVLSRVKRQYVFDPYYRRRYPIPIIIGGGGFGGRGYGRGFGGRGFGGRGFGRGFGGRGFGGRGFGGRGIGGRGGGFGGGRGGRG